MVEKNRSPYKTIALGLSEFVGTLNEGGLVS